MKRYIADTQALRGFVFGVGVSGLFVLHLGPFDRFGAGSPSNFVLSRFYPLLLNYFGLSYQVLYFPGVYRYNLGTACAVRE